MLTAWLEQLKKKINKKEIEGSHLDKLGLHSLLLRKSLWFFYFNVFVIVILTYALKWTIAQFSKYIFRAPVNPPFY